MASEWLETSLGEVTELKRGYDLARRYRIGGREPLISPCGVSNYTEAKANPVVTGRYGSYWGWSSYIKDDFWPLNTISYDRDTLKAMTRHWVAYRVFSTYCRSSHAAAGFESACGIMS